jgi:hypothetical protein
MSTLLRIIFAGGAQNQNYLKFFTLLTLHQLWAENCSIKIDLLSAAALTIFRTQGQKIKFHEIETGG